MATAPQIQQAAEWAADQYEARTRALAAGAFNIDWLPPESRVSWHEVAARFGLLGQCVDARLAFQEPFEAELRKRGLAGVLRGRLTAEQWTQRRPTC